LGDNVLISPEILSGCNKVAYHFRFGESLDSNKNDLQYHSVESIKKLAQENGTDDFLNWLSGFSDAESTFFINVQSSGKTGRKISFVYKIGGADQPTSCTK